MKKNAFSSYIDDFLEGSFTVYNYNPTITNDYCIYCQIAGFQRPGAKYYNEISNFPNYMINLTTKGKGVIVIDGETFELTEGSIVFLHNENHHILKKIPGEEWEFNFIHVFESEMVSKIYQSLAGSKGFVYNLESTKEFERCFKNIISLLSNKQSEYEIKISIEIYRLLMMLALFKPNRQGNETDDEVSKVVLYLKEHFNDKITMKKILKQTVYSKNHIERLFKRDMNSTIMDYLYSLRLNRAEELLLTTNKMLKEIAFEVGCSDYRALHYLFRTKLNCTPNEFRKTRKNPKL